MAVKKNPIEALSDIADHYDQIKGMNPHLTENQALEIVAKATGQTLANVKKRWKMLHSIDWPVLDYLERGVIGLNRIFHVLEYDLSKEEATEAMGQSLDEGVTDSAFKEWLARYMEKREAEAEAQAQAEAKEES